MAACSRRSVTARAKLLYEQQQRCFSPSISHTIPRDNDDKQLQHYTNSLPESPIFAKSVFASNGATNWLQDRRFSFLTGCGPVFTRKFSNWSSLEAGNAQIDSLTNVLADKSVDVAVPLLNEVDIAAEESSYPVAMMQYFIDNVHSFTGLNWWGTIVLTSLLISTVNFCVRQNLQKAISKYEILKKELDALEEKMDSQSMSSSAIAEGQTRINELRKQIGMNPLIRLVKSTFPIVTDVSYFLAVWNMAEKVPSFKDGGVLWFTDLSTPDRIFIPISMAAIYLIREVILKDQFLGKHPHIPTLLNVCWGFSIVRMTIYAFLPKALCLSGITADMFHLSIFLGKEFIRRNETTKMKG